MSSSRQLSRTPCAPRVALHRVWTKVSAGEDFFRLRLAGRDVCHHPSHAAARNIVASSVDTASGGGAVDW